MGISEGFMGFLITENLALLNLILLVFQSIEY